LIFLEND